MRGQGAVALGPGGRSLGAALAAALIRLYQRAVAPVLPPRCRYWPSCSEYARLAILHRGLLRGGLAAVVRLWRCQPLYPGGVDLPVGWAEASAPAGGAVETSPSGGRREGR